MTQGALAQHIRPLLQSCNTALQAADLVQSLNLGPICQASDSLSPRAPGSARRPFFEISTRTNLTGPIRSEQLEAKIVAICCACGRNSKRSTESELSIRRLQTFGCETAIAVAS